METSYSHLRDKLASVLDQVIENQEVVIIRRRGAKDVALHPAAELTGLMETAHLLPPRSPRNARRLLTACIAGTCKKGERPVTSKSTAGGAGLERNPLNGMLYSTLNSAKTSGIGWKRTVKPRCASCD